MLSFYGVGIALWIGNGGRSGFLNLGLRGNFGRGFLKKGFGFKNFSGSTAGMGFCTINGFDIGLTMEIGFGIGFKMGIGFGIGLTVGNDLCFSRYIVLIAAHV